jgi:spermidine/putrescine transport system permease protein
MTATNAPAPPAAAQAPPEAKRPSRLPWRNPWGHPWFLEGFTWLYLIWSLVPIAIAVLFSFNNGRSQSAWQGFSGAGTSATRSTPCCTTRSCTPR